jgi:hypothetical protein
MGDSPKATLQKRYSTETRVTGFKSTLLTLGGGNGNSGGRSGGDDDD